jgi:hypothetical protein
MSFLKLIVAFNREFYNNLTVPDANRILRNGWFDKNGLSQTIKLGMQSWSIPTWACHTGSLLSAIEGSVCKGCYAKRGNYTYQSVKDCLDQRLTAWQEQENWLEAITFLIRTTEPSKNFRWFDSGDLQDQYMLLQIIKIAKELPNFKFWLPTHEKHIVQETVEQGYEIPKNLKIWLSSEMVDGEPPLELAKELSSYPNVKRPIGTTVVLSKKEFDSYKGFKCPSSKQGNKCLDCTMCTNSNIDILPYKKK